MKLSQLKTLNKLADMLKVLDNAADQLQDCRARLEKDGEDSGGLPEFSWTKGYAIHINLWRDGSGHSVDLSGVYLAGEVLDAVEKEINKRYAQIEAVIQADFDVEVDLDDETREEYANV